MAELPKDAVTLQSLAGEVYALRCFASAVATALAKHPDFATELKAATLVGSGLLNGSHSSEKTIAAFDATLAVLTKAALGRKDTD